MKTGFKCIYLCLKNHTNAIGISLWIGIASASFQTIFTEVFSADSETVVLIVTFCLGLLAYIHFLRVDKNINMHDLKTQ